LKKVIFDHRKLNWFNIDVNQLRRKFKYIGIEAVDVNEFMFIDTMRVDYNIAVDFDEYYDGIKIYDFAIYGICNELIVFKDEIDTNLHRKTINKWLTLTRKILNNFNILFKKNKFSFVLAVNGHTLVDKCLIFYAKKHNIPFLCIENTCNKERVVWENIKGSPITYNFSKIFFAKYKDKVLTSKSHIYVDSYKNKINSFKKSEHFTTISNKKSPFEKPFILFLGQVYTDAAQLFSLKDPIKNPIKIIENVVENTLKHNVPLVIKLHPKEKEGVSPITETPYDSATYKRIKKFESENIIIDYTNEYNTYELIQSCRFAITLNSQAGLESTIFNKPLIAYKQSFFSNLGFTYDYESLIDLDKITNFLLENNIEKNNNIDAAVLFFYIFFEKYCISNTTNGILDKIMSSGNFSYLVNLKYKTLKLLSSN
jgi:capsule polysaccharide export protein KpsC/LpsZ